MTLSDPCEEAASVGTPFVMPHYFLNVRYWHKADMGLISSESDCVPFRHTRPGRKVVGFEPCTRQTGADAKT